MGRFRQEHWSELPFPPPGNHLLCLLHCRWILYQLSHQGSPYILPKSLASSSPVHCFSLHAPLTSYFASLQLPFLHCDAVSSVWFPGHLQHNYPVEEVVVNKRQISIPHRVRISGKGAPQISIFIKRPRRSLCSLKLETQCIRKKFSKTVTNNL